MTALLRLPAWLRYILLGGALVAALILAVDQYLSRRDDAVRREAETAQQALRDRAALQTHERIDNADTSVGDDSDDLDWLRWRGSPAR